MISVFLSAPKQRTNCRRRAYIFRFYNTGIGEPLVRLLTLTTTKLLSFISNIDGMLTLPVCISIWVGFLRITRNLDNCCLRLYLSVLQHRNWRASSLVFEPDDYEVAKLYFEYWWTCYRLYFYLSWFWMDHEQGTNCRRRAFIFRFYSIGIR